MSVKRIRTILIGCGMVGRMHAEVAAAPDNSELVAVCAPTPRRRSKLARRFGVPEFDDVGQMLGSLKADCALVASPDGQHVPHALQALEAGLHVFTEKPLGIVVDDATCSVRSFADDPDQFRCWRPNHFLAGNAFYESLQRHLSDFLTRLSQGEPPAVDGQDAVWATRLAEAAQRSHAQQKDVLP